MNKRSRTFSATVPLPTEGDYFDRPSPPAFDPANNVSDLKEELLRLDLHDLVTDAVQHNPTEADILAQYGVPFEEIQVAADVIEEEDWDKLFELWPVLKYYF